MADAASQERALGPHRGASAPCAHVRSFRCLPERALRRLWPEPWGRTRALPHGAEPLRPAPASTAAAPRAAPHLPAPCTGPALRGAAEPTGAHLGLQEPGHVRGRFPLISGSLGSFNQVKHVDTEMTVATGNSHSWTPPPPSGGARGSTWGRGCAQSAHWIPRKEGGRLRTGPCGCSGCGRRAVPGVRYLPG